MLQNLRDQFVDLSAQVARGDRITRRNRCVAVLLYVVLIGNLAFLVRQVAHEYRPRSCFGDPVEATPPAPQPIKKGEFV